MLLKMRVPIYRTSWYHNPEDSMNVHTMKTKILYSSVYCIWRSCSWKFAWDCADFVSRRYLCQITTGNKLFWQFFKIFFVISSYSHRMNSTTDNVDLILVNIIKNEINIYSYLYSRMQQNMQLLFSKCCPPAISSEHDLSLFINLL
jgi:hypothetical protein